MWAQRIGGLDFLPEESHVSTKANSVLVLNIDLSLIVLRAFN